MKEKSYSELMKSGAMNRKKEKEAYVLNLYIDMILSEALLNTEKEKLTRRIDQAIDNRDKKAFLQLSSQFKELNKRFGT
ncbi:IDEAL domain-containing protein [Bacillus dakarensis]|uniref:IDEAL domain-containing protein n=1 Tax=Robertmurraya dakarensis TaxID=1926278 RepID=UPI000981D103|nr:IDEAL domain-containing protein [Bacillus dakarensis]